MADSLLLKSWHAARDASFLRVNAVEFVARYGDVDAEYRRLRESAAVLDLSGRGRLCVLGGDRTRFLNGQLTNDIKSLEPWSGCYAALCNPKGRMEADARVYRLESEFLLDLEPGLLPQVCARFERFIIADDVELADASEAYGCLSVQGPAAGEAVRKSGLAVELPECRHRVGRTVSDYGEVYVVHHSRAGGSGFDVFVPAEGLEGVADRLLEATETGGGGLAGWEALEIARVEDGVPRFGADLDATTLPPEAGLDEGAVSYTKGCYVGQEVMGRLRTRGQVARRLVGFRLAGQAGEAPVPGEVVFQGDKRVGQVTSVVRSPRFGGLIALGYLRREVPTPSPELAVGVAGGWRAWASRLPLQQLTSGD